MADKLELEITAYFDIPLDDDASNEQIRHMAESIIREVKAKCESLTRHKVIVNNTYGYKHRFK
jgi:hypothetical protein